MEAALARGDLVEGRLELAAEEDRVDDHVVAAERMRIERHVALLHGRHEFFIRPVEEHVGRVAEHQPDVAHGGSSLRFSTRSARN